MAETEVGVGSKILLDGVTWDVIGVENVKVTKKADVPSVKYEAQLRARPLNRYMRGNPTVEEFNRTDLITEEYSVVRLKAKDALWNVYTNYKVSKGDL